jgi:hypothetical protein
MALTTTVFAVEKVLASMIPVGFGIALDIFAVYP